jgi:hypothetical protein
MDQTLENTLDKTDHSDQLTKRNSIAENHDPSLS